MQNLSYGKDFDLHENEPVGGTHFHMNGFTQRLVWALRQQPRPQSLLLDDFQNDGSSVKIVEEKALETRLLRQKATWKWPIQ